VQTQIASPGIEIGAVAAVDETRIRTAKTAIAASGIETARTKTRIRRPTAPRQLSSQIW